MTRPPAPPRVRVAGLALGAVLVPLALAACSGSDDGPDAAPGASSGPAGAAAVATQVHVGQVVGRLPATRRSAAVDGVQQVVDGWLDAAFPADGAPDLARAFRGFAPAAAHEARADRATLTAVGAGGAVPVARRLGVDLLATRAHARTATARVRVALRGDSGDDAGRRVLLARLFLTHDPREGWTVFGYDATQGRPRPSRPAPGKARTPGARGSGTGHGSGTGRGR